MPQRVIFINRFFFPDLSATSQMLSDLAFGLVQQGFEIAVVTSRQSYEKSGAALSANETVNNVQIHRVWSTTFGRKNNLGRLLDYLTFHLSATLKCLRLAQQGNILVAKTDPPLISIPIAWVARTREAILVNWLQDLFPEVLEAAMNRPRSSAWLNGLRSLRNRSLRKARANIVLGKIMASRVAEQGVPPDTIHIIENWSDGERVHPIPRARASNPLRTQWRLGNKFVVGYSGNLGVAHEFATILDAAALLNHHPDIAFLFIGAGAQLHRVRQAALDRDLAHIHFQPYQPQSRLAESLSVPDVHLVCLRPEMEGFIVPSKFYGVLAAGRPCIFIGDPNGELALVLRETGCGVVVHSDAAAELANAIATMISSPQRTAEMGHLARQIFETQYDRPHGIEKWARLLSTVAN